MMQPFFSFYGCKYRGARYYPAPVGSVIEPFAGAAGYSTYYEPARVSLVDADPIIVGVWQYLIRVTAAEVRALPDVPVGETVDNLRVPQEARWLLGFWCNHGSAQPKRTMTAMAHRASRAASCWPGVRPRIAAQVERIRHWKIALGSYADIREPAGTWFVDPPYHGAGKHYRVHDVNYAHLGCWCWQRDGFVIACENVGAAWLPFRPLRRVKSMSGASHEAIWLLE